MLTVERAVVSHKVTPSDLPGRSGRCSRVRRVCPGAAHPVVCQAAAITNRAVTPQQLFPVKHYVKSVRRTFSNPQKVQRTSESAMHRGKRKTHHRKGQMLDNNDAMRHNIVAASGWLWATTERTHRTLIHHPIELAARNLP